MQFLRTTILLWPSLLSLTAAAGTCSSSGALSWPPVGDCSTNPLKFDTLVQNCRACCLNDANCFQACVKAGGITKRGLTGEQVPGTIPGTKTLRSRAIALSCEKNENCYKYTDGSLLCLNLGTGKYHDDVGGNGDYFSGVYTGPDGKVQTGAATATATGGSRSSSAASQLARATTASAVTQASRATTASAQTTGSLQGASAGAASASASRAAAPVVLPLGFVVGGNVGLVGLVAGLVL